MYRKLLYSLLGILISGKAWGVGTSALQTEKQITPVSKFGSRSVGHLVTPNNNLMKKGEFGLGTLYFAYAVSDNFNLGVSPFAYSAFNMHNIMGRAAKNVSARERVGFDFAYFKTFDDRDTRIYGSRRDVPREYQYYNQFKMEAWNTKFTYNNQIRDWYRLNVATSFYYYIDDERPFSLRMDPANSDSYALNLTSLHELRLSEGIYWNLEAGLWGMNYAYPYFHVGTSFGLQSESILIALGVSSTFSPSFPQENVRYYAGYDSRYSIHPEFQIQGFF